MPGTKGLITSPKLEKTRAILIFLHNLIRENQLCQLKINIGTFNQVALSGVNGKKSRWKFYLNATSKIFFNVA